MSSFLRRHISYANVVATLALVLAMGGSALAARRYLISSTKQISPSVLKKLRGKAGPPGRTGAAGPVGSAGTAGKDGAPGKDGTNGATSSSSAPPKSPSKT